MVKIIECPRDAMQGLAGFVPTNRKADYLNALLRVGFDTLDFGSFVSPRVIPQMKDTAEVLEKLDLEGSETRLLAIVANVRGAEAALNHPQIEYLGFPFSVSETFQQRNTNQSVSQAWETVGRIATLCASKDRKLVAYLSMGFGNPYNDPYSPEIVAAFTRRLMDMGIMTISLSDTVGVASQSSIDLLFRSLISAYPDIEFGAHLHARPEFGEERIAAAYAAGCRRFDGALRGFGGCPMAKDDLVGNIATETIIRFLKEKENIHLDQEALEKAFALSTTVFV